MQRLLLLFTFTFFICNNGLPQLSGSFNVRQYNTENGLPSNLIRGIQWDDNTGFLWIVTEAGLVRMNGVEFKSYNKEKISPIAPEKQVYAVKNNTGAIFISDGSGNLFEIKKNKPVLSKPATLSSSFINYHFITVSEKFFEAKIKAAPAFSADIENVVNISDTSCLVLFQNAIYKFSVSDAAPVQLYKNVQALFNINSTTFFTDNNRQCYLLNQQTLLAEPANFTAANKELLNFGNGSSQLYWNTGMEKPVIIRGSEAWLLNVENNSITPTLLSSTLPTDANISSVTYIEKYRMLFIGTDSKGIIIINQKLVYPKRRKNANPKNRNAYFSQVALDNGNILTNEGDVIGDNTATTSVPISGKFSNRTSYTNDNLIWYNAVNSKLGFYCLHQYNKTTGQTKAFAKIKLLTQVEVSAGKTYLANNAGIGILQGDSMFFLYEYPKQAVNINTYDFKEISPGLLAVAGCGGLLRFNTANNKLDTIYSRENACFGSIWKYKDYIFWGSYGYGYYIYKNGRIKEMPVDKNEYLLYSHCFVQDTSGNCWISTNRGLFKAALNDIINHFETGISPIYYHYFGQKDGIEMTELNGGCTPCALTLSDQTISFPSMDGLLWVNPTAAKPFLPAGEIYVDEIIIDGKSTDPDSIKTKNLPAAVQEIVFNLGFSAWCSKENLYIDYQLNDTLNWKKLKTDDYARIQFSNLPAGRYTLRIRKLNGYGLNNYSYKVIEFTIEKRWYNQWWFYLLCAAVITALLYAAGKLRTRQYRLRQLKLEKQVTEKTKELQEKNEVLEKNNSIKTRLISIISHDIVTPLKFLTVAGKNLVEKRKQMPEELQQETITEMANTSQELQQLSTNILNWIKYQNENRRLAKENFNVHELVNQIFGVLNSIAKQKNVQLKNSVETGLGIQQYFEPLKILIHNLVSNAINFTEKGTIEVSNSTKGGQTIITVADEGVGMTAEQIKNIMADQFIISSTNIDNRKGNGLGYLIIKDLLKTMGASIEIKSEKGKGTIVEVVIPVNENK